MLRYPGVRVLIGIHACLGAMFVAVDLATIAFAARHGEPAAAGPLLGLYGLGSAIAGVWYGTRHWRAAQAARLTGALAATALGVAPLALMPGIWPMAAAITAAGLGISATLTTSYRIAETAVPAGQRTEAMSWLTTAAATGTALSAPLAGRLIDTAGAARRIPIRPRPRPGRPDHRRPAPVPPGSPNRAQPCLTPKPASDAKGHPLCARSSCT